MSGQKFNFMNLVYDVDKAKLFLIQEQRETIKYPIEKIVESIGGIVLYGIRHIPNIDKEPPIIISQFNWEGKIHDFPIDGWHRIKDAYMLGEKEINAVLLNVEETTKCLIVNK